jgi:nitrate reductase gamma subunit
MESALEFARGPLFAACFLAMALGLMRLVFLRIWDLCRLWRRASTDPFPVGQTFRDLATWLIPVTRLHRVRWATGVTSFIFHVGAIITPIFLADHVALWERAVGVSWYTLSAVAADVLTIATILAVLGLLAIRVFHAATRFMSGAADYLILALLLVVFASGYLASHPPWNLLSYNATMLIHVLAGNLLLAIMPFSKLAHAVLFPFERVSSEVYWRFPAGAGDRVAAALHGKEPAAL